MPSGIFARVGAPTVVLEFDFEALDSPGPIDLPGLRVGDIILHVYEPTLGGAVNRTEILEHTVSVDDEIQFLGAYLSGSGHFFHATAIRLA